MGRNILVPKLAPPTKEECSKKLELRLPKCFNINIDPRVLMCSNQCLYIPVYHFKPNNENENNIDIDLFVTIENKDHRDMLEKVCEALESLLSINKDIAKSIFETSSRCFLNKSTRTLVANKILNYFKYMKIEVDKNYLEVLLNKGIINNIVISYFLLESIKTVLRQRKNKQDASKIKIFIEPHLNFVQNGKIIEIRADMIVVEELNNNSSNRWEVYKLKAIIEVKRIKLIFKNKSINLEETITDITKKISKYIHNLIKLELDIKYVLIIHWLDEKSLLKKYKISELIFNKLLKILSLEEKLLSPEILKKKLEDIFKVKIIVGNISRKVFRDIVNIFI